MHSLKPSTSSGSYIRHEYILNDPFKPQSRDEVFQRRMRTDTEAGKASRDDDEAFVQQFTTSQQRSSEILLNEYVQTLSATWKRAFPER